MAKFVKDPIYRTKVIVRKRPCCQKLCIVTVTFDPNINRVLLLPQGNHVVKIQYTELVIMRKQTLLSKNLFIVTVTLTFDPKINRILSLSLGNHVVKFGKDPIYRTKVMWKQPCCQKLYL